MAPTCEKNVQIKLTPKNYLLIIFNVVYIEVNETRKKLWTDKQYIFKNLFIEHKLAWKTCKTHTYSISVKQSLVWIILYNGFSNNETDIGLLVVEVFLKNYFLWKILNIFVQSTW